MLKLHFMNGYTVIDVLRVYSKRDDLTFENLKSYFPESSTNYSYLQQCYKILQINEYIQSTNQPNGSWKISAKGLDELRRSDEEREISRRKDLLQIQTLETELPLIQKKLKDYNIYKWVSIISGIVSIISVGILLITLFSHK
jgi:hypothetical protein